MPVRDNDNAARLQQAFLNVDLTDRLDGIGQRVLVLYGARDAIAAAAAPKFASLPHVEFAVLPTIGHELFADAPQLALEHVTAFLSRPEDV